jgi:hypothetical protein
MTPEQVSALRVRYEAMEDLQLEDIYEDYNGLEEEAQGLLRNEMVHRGLWEKVTKAHVPHVEHAPAHRFTHEEIAQGGIAVAEYEDGIEAALAGFVLEREGVANATVPPGTSLDRSGTQVRVAPDDVERAMDILKKPIDADVREEFEQSTEEFALLPCPQCGSSDVVLEGADETNHWLCDVCGHRWVDAMDVTHREDAEGTG